MDGKKEFTYHEPGDSDSFVTFKTGIEADAIEMYRGELIFGC